MLTVMPLPLFSKLLNRGVDVGSCFWLLYWEPVSWADELQVEELLGKGGKFPKLLMRLSLLLFVL